MGFLSITLALNENITMKRPSSPGFTLIERLEFIAKGAKRDFIFNEDSTNVEVINPYPCYALRSV